MMFTVNKTDTAEPATARPVTSYAVTSFLFTRTTIG